MIATLLSFAGGVISSVVIYKIITNIKKESRNKNNLVADVKRLKDKVKFMEMDLDWLKVRAENWEKQSFELHNLKSDVKLIKSKLEEENAKIIQYNHPIVEEALSSFSTEELIEALKLKEDVQVTDTSEDVYRISMDLMKVKKHVLVINNYNPSVVEQRRREMDRFAGGCCD
ncbi:hypothetical protein [Bacillus cereus group sp. BfR-BA-01448]|uniref:hypothetical protein n=1 Tax=Bacillus cereus group sp. BfR-BA-01448 TaxID=2920352 RepID=UPI001F5984BE|nr:hypothetical protein [Bacillus cereus group sp. BfR-BA-01448]